MSDIIHLLPDSIANQIAAGEVIQRPASVVKELLENALDAGATDIKLIIKDAGRTLIQVIDNGKGMSPTDARMAFERHATSKIRSADDLFTLQTMGFRGEALPSIASVAQVELKTKRPEDELGTFIRIAGSKVEAEEAISCPVGSNFAVRNIFFNVPARRKFLKGNETEKRNIIVELERVAMVNPEITFSLVDGDTQILSLPAGSLRQRIVHLVGKSFSQQLIPVEIDTSLVKITGFVARPETARKMRALQYFFVNGRYMRHPYFNKAVASAFEQLILPNESPNFFLFLQVAPDTLDVNIHPTKTEIKFENETPIWQIINAVVKEALGKSNETPSIDFDKRDAVDIPIYDPSHEVKQPQVRVNPNYNPFANWSEKKFSAPKNNYNWEKLYSNLEQRKSDYLESTFPQDTEFFPQNRTEAEQALPSASAEEEPQLLLADESMGKGQYLQYKNAYILTSVKSGLMLIDQHRAHLNVLYYRFLESIRQHNGASQRVLFPEVVEFSASEATMLPYILDDLLAIGFEISHLGGSSYSITAVPADIKSSSPVQLLQNMLHRSIETGSDVKDEIQEILAFSLAELGAIGVGQMLSNEEMTQLVEQLFSTPTPNHTPKGKPVITILKDGDISKMFR